MSRYRVVHTSTFDYTAEVRASYNEARLTPAQGRGQSLAHSETVISQCSDRYDYTDYWGTHVTAFEVLTPHRHLEVVADSVVEVSDEVPPEVLAQPFGWDAITSEKVRDQLSVYLGLSATTLPPPELAATAQEIAAEHDPHTAARLICLAVRDAVEYVPGVTTVHSTAREAWLTRKGVCQDMAHLSVGALRSVGIPALYVSGYNYPGQADDGHSDAGGTVQGQSHAWVEWWADGWRAYDPTNGLWATGTHVVVGRGREYSDVAPFTGVFAGGATSGLSVVVEMTQLTS